MSVSISIIVPCYHAEEHIEHLVHQIIAQSYKDFELILVGNGEGQEKQDTIIKALASKHRQIQYATLPTGNVSAARNYGMDLAKGRWTIFVDADDEFSTDYISSFATRANNADIICAGYDVVYDRVSVQHQPACNLDSASLNPSEAYATLLKVGHTIGMVWCKMFSTQFLKDSKLRFDTSLTLCEDSVFCCQAFLKARHFVIFPHCGYSYHRRQSYSALDRHHPCLLRSMRTTDDLLAEMKRIAGYSEETIAHNRMKKEYGWAIDEITGTFRLGSPYNFKSRVDLIQNWFESDCFWTLPSHETVRLSRNE